MFDDLLEFAKRYTTYPVEDNPKKSAFIAFVAGAVADRFGWSAASWLLGLLF
jgi:hypothetical protein